jgi:iron complex transport system substrate-binding protein
MSPSSHIPTQAHRSYFRAADPNPNQKDTQHMTRTPRLRPMVLALLASLLLAGCGSSTSNPPSTTASANGGEHYPVTITNCGTPITFDSAPTRAVSNDINTTEDMLALGLQHAMIGTFGVTGDGPASEPVPKQYAAAFHSVRDVSPEYFTLEPLIGLHPDFLFAGWNYGLQQGTNLTPQGLAKYAIKTLALTESCAHVEPAKKQVSVGNTYEDLRNLGTIFDVQARANTLIAQMKAQIAAVRAKVANLPPVSVFDYDSGTSAPFTAPGLATLTALIELAGGANIFASLKQSWTSVSWEQVIARKPQCIIINDYGTPTWQQKAQFLKTDAASRNLPAVRNHCIIHLAYDEVTPSPRNTEAVTAIARLLHPTAFGLPVTSGAALR